jgi:hypothetical protein
VCAAVSSTVFAIEIYTGSAVSEGYRGEAERLYILELSLRVIRGMTHFALDI